ncbi:hypothetical protein DRN69_02075 [Candidatus Pacearchaeota archaeon]|nr:MAG: hypothetical protein DRN69_02075 [Candidatus Pacearchaeota archaeon]
MYDAEKKNIREGFYLLNGSFGLRVMYVSMKKNRFFIEPPDSGFPLSSELARKLYYIPRPRFFLKILENQKIFIKNKLEELSKSK